jgi:hypothetical protein
MEDIPNEVKVLHIHKGAEGKRDFVEFIVISTGKSHILTDAGFIKRYGDEVLKEFK